VFCQRKRSIPNPSLKRESHALSPPAAIARAERAIDVTASETKPR